VSQPAPRRDPEERRRRVLAAAVEEFARSSYAGASTNRIAQRARVAKGLIFHHFGSKQALYEAALEEAWALILAPIEEPLPADPYQRLEAALMEQLRRLHAYPEHARLVGRLLGQSARILGGPFRARLEERLHHQRVAFCTGIAPQSFRPGIAPQRAIDLLGLVAEGLVTTWLQRLNAGGLEAVTPAAAREQVRSLMELLRKGIYQPGRSAVAQPLGEWDPTAFLNLTARLAPSPKEPDQRRDRILRAAQRLFAARGYDGTSAEAIAEEAGVAKGLIFHHFGSKAGLYLAAVGDAATQMSTAFLQDLPPPPADLFQRICAWSQRKVQVFRAFPTLYQLSLAAFANPPEAVRPALEAYAVEGLAEGWTLLLKGIDTSPFRPDVPPARALELVMLVVDTFTNREMVQLTSEPDQSLERLAHLLQEVGQYLELLRDGLGPA